MSSAEEIDFGEIVETHTRLDGTEDIITTVYAHNAPSTIKREVKVVEDCSNKDDVLKELLTAAGLVDKYGTISIEIKQGRLNKPYLVTRRYRTSYEKLS